MSGQFPAHHHLPVGTPPTMENLGGWSHSTRRQTHGMLQGTQGLPALNQQSVYQSPHTMVPQAAHLPSSLSQLPGLVSWSSKVPGAHNGSDNSISSNSTSGLSAQGSSQNSLLNLRMLVNQEQSRGTAGGGFHLPNVPSMQSDTMDLSRIPRTSDQGQTEPISLVSGQNNKESHYDIRNGGVISSAGSLGTVNGDTNAHSPAAVSVIASAPKSAGSVNMTEVDGGCLSSVKQSDANSLSDGHVSVLSEGHRRPNSEGESLAGTGFRTQSPKLLNPSVSVISGNGGTPPQWGNHDQKLHESEPRIENSLSSSSNEIDVKILPEGTLKCEEQEVKEGAISEVVTVPIKVEHSDVKQENTDQAKSSESLPLKSEVSLSAMLTCGSGLTSEKKSDPSQQGATDIPDVESQMEALFAGIADDGNGGETTPSTVLSTSLGTPNIAAVLESKCSSSKKGRSKVVGNGIRRSSDSIMGTSSAESTPKKVKQKKRTGKDDWSSGTSKKTKKGCADKGKSKFIPSLQSYDSGSSASSSRIRGPVVHIEGPREAPTRITIINAPSRVDDDDNDSRKKGSGLTRTRKSYQSEGYVTSTGLCSNSLVARYEAHSSDTQWICVFCKVGPHVGVSGDLFGPYLVGQNETHTFTNALEVESERKHPDKKDKKLKRTSSAGLVGLHGLLAIPAMEKEPMQYIVWAHEDCIVWSGGVHLIGSRLDGLQDAVWEAVNTRCAKCHTGGANIGCVQHGCFRRVHYRCALDEGWNMDEETFISTCTLHQKHFPQGVIFPT